MDLLLGIDILLYKDKFLVCNVNNLSYLYNLETKNVVEISNTIQEGHPGCKGKIAFYNEDFVICKEGEKIVLKDFDGNILNEELYKLDENEFRSILEISMISENKLQITLEAFETDGSFSNYEAKIIDFEASTIANGENVYSKLININ